MKEQPGRVKKKKLLPESIVPAGASDLKAQRILTYGLGASGRIGTLLLGLGASGRIGTLLLGLGASGRIGTLLFGLGASGRIGTFEAYEIAIFVATTRPSVTSTERKRFIDFDMRMSPIY